MTSDKSWDGKCLRPIGASFIFPLDSFSNWLSSIIPFFYPIFSIHIFFFFFYCIQLGSQIYHASAITPRIKIKVKGALICLSVFGLVLKPKRWIKWDFSTLRVIPAQNDQMVDLNGRQLIERFMKQLNSAPQHKMFKRCF